MEKYDKEVIANFRSEIAELEKSQRITKQQRKTVHYKGERTMGPSEATYLSELNSEKLRIMYASYNLLRGKGFDVTEKGAKLVDGEHPLFMYLNQIDDCLSKYGYKLPSHEEQKTNFWGKTYNEKVFDKENYEKIVRVGQ